MNTVDALKDLYKTLCGKDYAGDPNPTDAEMIKAIAKDASTGGSGSGSGSARIIDLTTLEHSSVTDDNDVTTDTYSGYETGLSAEDFINSWFMDSNSPFVRSLHPAGRISSLTNPETGVTIIGLSYGIDYEFTYKPDTGEFYYTSEGGAGGKDAH